MSEITISPLSSALSYLDSSANLAREFRQYAIEMTGSASFPEISESALIDAIDEFLRQAAYAWLRPTRVNADSDTWVDIGKRIKSACQGHPANERFTIACQLRKSHAKPPAVSPDRLAGDCQSVLASLPKSERGKELYRFVAFEIRPTKPKKIEDAFDLLPFEGSTHPGSTSLYAGASAPVTRVDGIDRTVTIRADRDTETRLVAAKEKVGILSDLRSKDRKYRETLRIRSRFVAREYRARIDALVDENARLQQIIADLTAPKTRSRTKKPAAPTVV